MTDIVDVQTDVALPTLEESQSLCFALSADDLAENIKKWREHGEDGSEICGAVVICRSVKSALEGDHPYKDDFVVKDFKHLAKEHDALISHTDTDFAGGTKYPFRQSFQRQVSRRVCHWLPYLLTQAVRECTVRQHAFGNSTVNVVRHLISEDCETANAFQILADRTDYLKKEVIEWLVPRLAYLKKGSSSFPEKYRDLWRESRKEYLASIRDLPLTETPEQVKALSELYARLDVAFEATESDRGKSLIANSMVKVMSGLFTLTRDPAHIPIVDNQ